MTYQKFIYGPHTTDGSATTTPYRDNLKTFNRFIEFFIPRYCKVCGRRLDPAEEHLCITCYLKLPTLDNSDTEFNLTERKFITERSVVHATSFLCYSKESDYRKLLFHLKYWNHPNVGFWLAKIYAQRLVCQGFFDGVECIIPLPLSPRKERRRGYNQSMYIARGVNAITHIPIVKNVVIRVEEHTHQAGLGKYQRWENAQGLFKVKDGHLLSGKHILVVDDVMTTGATLCSMIETMEQYIPDVKISVFTLALAEQ